MCRDHSVYARPANERWRYIVTPSLFGWAHTQNDPWMCMALSAFRRELFITLREDEPVNKNAINGLSTPSSRPNGLCAQNHNAICMMLRHGQMPWRLYGARASVAIVRSVHVRNATQRSDYDAYSKPNGCDLINPLLKGNNRINDHLCAKMFSKVVPFSLIIVPHFQWSIIVLQSIAISLKYTPITSLG